MQFNAIANAHLVSTSGRTLAVIDPSNGQSFDTLQRSNAQDVDHAVHAARQCYDAVWCKVGAAERARLLMQLAAKVTEHTDELAALEQRDSGKPPRQARAAAQALAHRLAFYAGACDTLPGAAHSFSADSVYTWREPQGVTGHLVPWADPLPMLGRSVGAALAAGNVCVVKPSEHASLGVLRVAQLAAEAGLPAGALNIVTGQGQEAGDALVRHPGVDHIHFAGSATVGTLIQQTAAERHCLVTLELSGKSPQIVFADADLDTALPAIVHAIVHNAGQSGSAGSRVLIDALPAGMRALVAVHHPLREVGTLGTALTKHGEAALRELARRGRAVRPYGAPSLPAPSPGGRQPCAAAGVGEDDETWRNPVQPDEIAFEFIGDSAFAGPAIDKADAFAAMLSLDHRQCRVINTAVTDD